MSGWVPIPREALDACEPAEWIAVVDLYQRANAVRWRTLRLTERAMVARWGLGNRRVWSLLEDLEAMGLLTVEKGGRRAPTRVTVNDPTETGERRESSEARHSDQHSDQQNEAGATPTIVKCAAQPTAQDAETLVRSKTKIQEESAPDGWEECARVYRDEVRPSMGLRATKLVRSKGMGATLAKWLRQQTAAEVSLILRWVATCQDDRPGGADFHRSRQSGLDTLYRHRDRYLDMAQNPPGNRATGPPSQPLSLPPKDERSPEERATATARLRSLRARSSATS